MSSLSGVPVSLRILLLIHFVFTVSGVQKLTLTPERGSALNISRVRGSECKLCTGAGRSQSCDTSVLLKDNSPVSVEFKCSRPEDVFKVEIVRTIECTAKSCNGQIHQTDFGSGSLMDFNRSFTWKLKASAPKAVQVGFAKVGMRQISPSVSCADGHTYTLKAIQDTGEVVIGRYCRTGTISSAQILNQGSFSLEVPAGQKLQNGQFDVSVGEEIKSLAKIKISLPPGTSSSELLSPNYPDSFPDDDVMDFYFQFEAKQKATVHFLDLTQPRCLKKETAVEYHSRGRGALVLRLTDTQPVQNQGDFSLTLRNCEMDRRRAGSPGLSLKLKVSTSRASSPVSCSVDLRKMKGLSLHVDKRRRTSECEMKINSVTSEKITVSSDGVAQLSFQDCVSEDLQVSAVTAVGCSQLKDCPKPPVPLLVPVLPSCLPTPLSRVTWTLHPPEHGTVELMSSSAPLRQALPGQPCNDSIINVSEGDGTMIGRFCPQGPIQKLQIHTSVTVTVTSANGKALRPSVKPVLTACLKEEIPERYIFTVSPKKDVPVLLASPGWPVGMKSYSTISWIVSIPPKMEAHLMFANLSQPKCSKGHANIRVQRSGSLEEDYSRREDEEAESEITVSESFYLNMSNCMPERGDFSVITKITLQKSKSLLLTIILSVVAALLLICVTVLVVVCVVIRKKKKKLDHQVSIYNPNGTSFLPGPNGFPKSREDNESHVYASIEDSLVYTHLLRKGVEMGVYGEFDTYRPFTGHTDSQKPLVSKDASADSTEAAANQQFQVPSQTGPPLPVRPPSHGRLIVDNEIYETNNREEGGSERMGPRLDPEGGN
ncbi:CUB domain-containing protein 1a [Aulostomus maculatus]